MIAGRLGYVVAEGYIQLHRECFPELYRLDPVDDDVLEPPCAVQRRQIIAAQIAPPVGAPAEVGQVQVAVIEQRAGEVGSGEFRFS